MLTDNSEMLTDNSEMLTDTSEMLTGYAEIEIFFSKSSILPQFRDIELLKYYNEGVSVIALIRQCRKTFTCGHYTSDCRLAGPGRPGLAGK